MRLKVQEIVRSKTFKMLSTNRREQIKSHLQYVWQETGVVDGQHFLDILPSGLQEDVLRELCLEMLKKVYVFKRFDEQILKEICDHLKPVLYAKGHCIVRKDERIKAMFFIIGGTVLFTVTARDSYFGAEEYRDGEFWGEEIAISCLHPQWNWEPMSNGKVRAATEVQAFALELDDLNKALEKIKKLPNLYSLQWKTKNARIIQISWHRYKKKKKELQITLNVEENSLQFSKSKPKLLLEQLV
ncbi:cyclic nucleotide-gated ion channel 1-like [Mangifera indica]|uniref:cyclic nucleotide-gated ion channel 1-like n=1 Tax=Mangifera indica TaxID=29780 RepID=UPI001CFBFF8E|nr:cyclic nucleotide-gated ion channel 1-like [Mangifera indica]